MTARTGLGAQWRRSSRSQLNGDCLEARHRAGVVEVRDSKDPHGPVLTCSPSHWQTFVRSVPSPASPAI